MNLNSLVGNAQVELECPSCGHAFNASFKQISNEDVLQCPSCNSDIQIEIEGESKNSLSSVDRATRDFDKTIRDINRTFKKLGK